MPSCLFCVLLPSGPPHKNSNYGPIELHEFATSGVAVTLAESDDSENEEGIRVGRLRVQQPQERVRRPSKRAPPSQGIFRHHPSVRHESCTRLSAYGRFSKFPSGSSTTNFDFAVSHQQRANLRKNHRPWVPRKPDWVTTVATQLGYRGN